MLRKKIIFTICFILFYISNLSAELNYKKVGQWDLKMGRANFAMTSGSWWVDVMQGGTLSLGQDKGEIHTCIEDGYTYNEPKNLIWVELECSITMPDKSKIYLEYSSKLTPDDTFWDKLTKIEKNKVLSIFLSDFGKIDHLIEYFEKYNINLSKKTLNSFIKSVSNP